MGTLGGIYGHNRLVNFFGGLVGWIASKIMGTDAQQGILLNIIVGVIGAFIGGFLWGLLTNDPEPYELFDIGSWITAIMGASILLYLVRLVRGRSRVYGVSRGENAEIRATLWA